MGWWPWSSGATQAPASAPASVERKCKSRRSALAGCRRANPSDSAIACKNLESALAVCLAEEVCKADADEHRRCYTSCFKTGSYKGVAHCMSQEEAMLKCLRKQKLHPFSA
ncbi:hypothetical protein HYH03_008708 [Edaphochlamys debaryana]|uniref:Uncharacterized protein n=1 Tax=Edaphochlamys debaryana TaxID=47281 RepID=A0A836BXZ0_9CHLO|nr:hypothetical protein HYH03_008708 [Edaphochlamys debaryana]|eukprot:KAG2493045.1 hypothetical protein HYH03_008708 [Edaphochlamys debaryana]